MTTTTDAPAEAPDDDTQARDHAVWRAVQEYAPEAVRRAIGEVGPEALGRLADAHRQPHVYGALWGLMRDVSWVGKTETMSAGAGGNYAFRSVEQVIAALGSRARHHGLALASRHIAGPEYDTYDVEKRNGGSTRWTTCRGLVIEWSWTSLVDGSTISAVGVGEGRDSSDKATNKAMTAAYKYALTQSTMLPTFDPDPDGDHPEIEDAPRGQGGDQGGGPAAEGADEAGPSPSEVLAGIRQATDMNRLGEIYDWLDANGGLQQEIEGQTFLAHLEAARAIVAPPEGDGQT